MSDYKFGGMLYRTRADMLDAIAYDWASGGISEAYITESLATYTDRQLAEDCIATWELDRGDEYGEIPSHMAAQGYTADDLTAAFADLRDLRHQGERE